MTFPEAFHTLKSTRVYSCFKLHMFSIGCTRGERGVVVTGY